MRHLGPFSNGHTERVFPSLETMLAWSHSQCVALRYPLPTSSSCIEFHVLHKYVTGTGSSRERIISRE
jgi:hypothetical protein